jgi:prophage regulatory protein
MQQIPTTDRYIRFPELRTLVALSRTTIWRLVRCGTFPPPRRIGPGAVGWLLSEVAGWMANRATTVPRSRLASNGAAAAGDERGRRG